MPLTGVEHLGFTVTDLNRTTEWYCEHLGFEPLIRYTNADIGQRSRCCGTRTCHFG